MSAPLAHNLQPDRTAQVALLCAFAEKFGSAAQQNRPLRLHTLTRIRWALLPDCDKKPIESTNDLSTDECKIIGRFIRETPVQRAERMLRRAAAELAPAADCLDAPTANAAHCLAAETDTVERVLSFWERIGEVGHDGRFGAGDSANLLIAEHPEARPRDVLTEHLRSPEAERFKAFLCPQLPWADDLPAEVRLKMEATVLETLLKIARVAARIPDELRDRYPTLGWAWFQAAATMRQPRDGRMTTPTLADIERRLNAAADNQGLFRRIEDLRQWINNGEVVTERQPTEKPDLADSALAAFRSAFYDCDSIVAAWERTFSAGGAFTIKARAAR
jgi:hypothetical protein